MLCAGACVFQLNAQTGHSIGNIVTLGIKARFLMHGVYKISCASKSEYSCLRHRDGGIFDEVENASLRECVQRSFP